MLEQGHLCSARVKRFASVDLPFLKLVQEELKPREQLHEGRGLRGECREHVVGKEERVLEDGGLILCEDVLNSY